MESKMKTVTEINEWEFGAEVRRSNKVVLVAFLAPWSRPCQVLRPVLDEVAAMEPGKVKIDLVDADDNPRLSMSFGIESVPTLLYFVGARPRARLAGMVSKEEIIAQLDAVSHVGDSTFRAQQKQYE